MSLDLADLKCGGNELNITALNSFDVVSSLSLVLNDIYEILYQLI